MSEQDSSHVEDLGFDPVPGQDQIADQALQKEATKYLHEFQRLLEQGAGGPRERVDRRAFMRKRE